MKPRGKPNIGPDKEREVNQSEFQEPDPLIDGSIAPDEDTEELIQDVEKVEGKAKRLFDAAAAVCRKKKVPVIERASEIKEAVNRLDPESDGSTISFELYMQAKERSNRQLDDDEVLKFAGDLTGTVIVDAGVNLNKKDSDSIPSLNAVKHFALLYLANQLLAGPLSNETQKQTSAKEPKGAESPGMFSSWIVTLGLMSAMHSEDGKKGLKSIHASMEQLFETAAELDIPSHIMNEIDSVDNYASQIKPARELVTDHLKDSDWAKMEQYADDWLANTEEPGYEDWFIASLAKETGRAMHMSGNELHKWADAATLGGLSYNKNKAGLDLPNDTYKYHRCKTNHANLRLDMLAAALHSNYSADMVCCLILFLGSDNIDLNALKALRTFLGLLLKGLSLDLGKLHAKMMSSYRKALGKALLEPIFHDLRKLFAKVGKDIQKWLASDEDKWKKLFACTPIDEMFTYLLKALKNLEKILFKLIKQMWDDTKFKGNIGKLTVGSIADKKRLTQFIAILNGVIKAVEKGRLCAKEDTVYPPTEEARRVADLLLGDMPQPPELDLPDPEDPYADFLPVTFDTPNGIRIRPAHETSKGNFDIKEISPKDCIKRMTEENALPLVITSKEGMNVKRFFTNS